MKRAEELLQELRQGPARLKRKQGIASLANALAIMFFLASAFVFFPLLPQQYRTPTILVVWLVIAQGIVLATVFIRSNLELDGPQALKKQEQKVFGLILALHTLREKYPELALLSDVSEELGDERARSESKRSFWFSVWFGLFFTLLGFALSYVATKLGWLP